MEKSDIRVIIGIFFLLALVLVINNSHWFVPNRFAGEEKIEQEDVRTEQRDGTVEIMERAEGDLNEFVISEGRYYFHKENAGICDITSNADNMQIDGKILNKGCCLENYMPIKNGILEIKGEGTVTFRNINGKAMELEDKKGKTLIKNSGYYQREFIIGSSEDKMTLYCQANDATQEMPRVQIIETYTRKVIDEFQWETGEEGYTCKLEKGQSIFVDLGNETKKHRNTLFVMH